jgi:glutathione synthase/RimK-type ligase-like ATP-grasp enzyme
MPKGPRGEKRPADAVGLAVLVGKIAIGEAEDTTDDPTKEHHRKGGKKGGAARAAKLTPEQRSEIAKKAAAKRWSK